MIKENHLGCRRPTFSIIRSHNSVISECWLPYFKPEIDMVSGSEPVTANRDAVN